MNIGIIGQGFVGNAIYQKFKSYYKVRTYDLFIGKRTHDQMDVITKSDGLHWFVERRGSQGGARQVVTGRFLVAVHRRC